MKEYVNLLKETKRLFDDLEKYWDKSVKKYLKYDDFFVVKKMLKGIDLLEGNYTYTYLIDKTYVNSSNTEIVSFRPRDKCQMKIGLESIKMGDDLIYLIGRIPKDNTIYYVWIKGYKSGMVKTNKKVVSKPLVSRIQLIAKRIGDQIVVLDVGNNKTILKRTTHF